jgi:DNA-binding transcriptional ArsR family regulator
MAIAGKGRAGTLPSAGRRAGGESQARERPDDAQSGHWTFLSNHGHVLVCLARDPDARLRDVAQSVGITERAVQKIVSDLEAGGVVERVRDGRRNRYRLFVDRPLRHPLEAHRTVGSLLGMVLTATAVRRLGDGTPESSA